MGSKRSSSKVSKAPSIAPPAAPPADKNFQSPRSHNPESPSNSQKKPKLAIPKPTDSAFFPLVLPPKVMKHKLPTPKSTDSGFLSPIPSADGEDPSQNINRKGKALDISNEISPSAGRASRSASVHWGKACNLKFLESLVAFRLKYGILPTPSRMVDFLTEISDWAPSTLSGKNVRNKIRNFRFMFQKNPELRPECSEYERTLHQLRLQLWGPESLKAAGALHEDALKEDVRVERKGDRKGQKEKAASEKLNGEKQIADDDKEYEDDEDEQEEEGDDENDEGGGEKAAQTMEIESVKVHEKDDLLVGEDNSVLDGDVTKFPYKYLKLALEEYWTEAKLNMNTLYSALHKVDPVQAKLLDEQYSEVFMGMLKLKMEKNELFNKIISSSLGS